jgi:hypothetical protein
MSRSTEIPLPTSKKEAVRKIAALQKESQELQYQIDILEFTNRSIKLYMNIGTASTVSVVSTFDAR